MCAQEESKDKELRLPGFPTLHLQAKSLEALRHWLDGRAHLRVHSQEPVAAGQRVLLMVDIKVPHPYTLPLQAKVKEMRPVGKDTYEFDLVLSPASALELREAASWLPCRRQTDVEPTTRFTGRSDTHVPAECYISSLWQRIPATVLDVSTNGAFIAIPAPISRGDYLWFRAHNDDEWHGATVCWAGNKGTQAGVGVELSFPKPNDRARWYSYLTYLAEPAEQA